MGKNNKSVKQKTFVIYRRTNHKTVTVFTQTLSNEFIDNENTSIELLPKNKGLLPNAQNSDLALKFSNAAIIIYL